MATGYDPVTKLKDAPNNPKERYKIMTNEMPKGFSPSKLRKLCLQPLSDQKEVLELEVTRVPPGLPPGSQ